MLSKYNIRDAATRQVTDRQTDRMFGYNHRLGGSPNLLYKPMR